MDFKLLEPYYQKYAFHAAQTRGVILGECILLERLIDKIIADFFCDDENKKDALMDIILCTKRITFESKITTFREILNRRFPDNEKKNTSIYKTIISVIEDRNMFAHYILDYSNQAVVDYIQTQTAVTLLKYDKKRVSQLFTKDKIIDIVGKIHQLTSLIIKLHEHPETPPDLDNHKSEANGD